MRSRHGKKIWKQFRHRDGVLRGFEHPWSTVTEISWRILSIFSLFYQNFLSWSSSVGVSFDSRRVTSILSEIFSYFSDIQDKKNFKFWVEIFSHQIQLLLCLCLKLWDMCVVRQKISWKIYSVSFRVFLPSFLQSSTMPLYIWIRYNWI